MTLALCGWGVGTIVGKLVADAGTSVVIMVLEPVGFVTTDVSIMILVSEEVGFESSLLPRGVVVKLADNVDKGVGDPDCWLAEVVLLLEELEDKEVEGVAVDWTGEEGIEVDGAAIEEGAAVDEAVVDKAGIDSVGAAMLLAALLPPTALNGICPSASCKGKRVTPRSQQPTVGRLASQQ